MEEFKKIVDIWDTFVYFYNPWHKPIRSRLVQQCLPWTFGAKIVNCAYIKMLAVFLLDFSCPTLEKQDIGKARA